MTEFVGDLLQEVRGEAAERAGQRVGLRAPGDHQVVEVAWDEGVVAENPATDLFREDLRAGFKRDRRSSHGVDRPRVAGEGGSRGDADFAAVLEQDEGVMGAHLHFPDLADGAEVAFKGNPVLLEPGVGTGFDEEVQIVGPPVLPTGNERGAAAENQVVFAAEVTWPDASASG